METTNFAAAVTKLAVFDRERQPPELNLDALRVEVVHHFLDGVARKGLFCWLPVAVVIEPTVIQRGPVNAQFLQLRDGVQHLLGRNPELVAPATPAHRIVFRVIRGLGQAFALNRVGPHAERFVEIAPVDGQESARRGERFAGFEDNVRG